MSCTVVSLPALSATAANELHVVSQVEPVRVVSARSTWTPERPAAASEADVAIGTLWLALTPSAYVIEPVGPQALGWLQHSVRALLSARIGKELKLPLVKTRRPGEETRYHIGALRPGKE